MASFSPTHPKRAETRLLPDLRSRFETILNVPRRVRLGLLFGRGLAWEGACLGAPGVGGWNG